MSQILIVDDEPRIAAFVAKGLRAAGYATVMAESGRDALDILSATTVDLVILDIGLPDIDGLEVLRQLRGQGYDVPVIMLTARSAVVDRVAGLEGGADDYMSKPFGFEELLARVRLRLRQPSTTGSSTELEFADIKLDLRTRQAQNGSQVIDLSAREFALLEVFLQHPGQVLTREQLLDRVWGYDFDPGSNVVDVYIRYLRNKLGAAYFVTVRGMGYRLVDPSQAPGSKR